MLLLGEARLGLSQIEDEVRAFDSFDGAIHQLADAARIFLIDRLPLGFAHLLKNHLLGGLSGDAPQQIGRLGDADFRLHLSRRIDAARFLQRHLNGGILHRFHYFLHREQVYRTGLFV